MWNTVREREGGHDSTARSQAYRRRWTEFFRRLGCYAAWGTKNSWFNCFRILSNCVLLWTRRWTIEYRRRWGVLLSICYTLGKEWRLHAVCIPCWDLYNHSSMSVRDEGGGGDVKGLLINVLLVFETSQKWYHSTFSVICFLRVTWIWAEKSRKFKGNMKWGVSVCITFVALFLAATACFHFASFMKAKGRENEPWMSLTPKASNPRDVVCTADWGGDKGILSTLNLLRAVLFFVHVCLSRFLL